MFAGYRQRCQRTQASAHFQLARASRGLSEGPSDPSQRRRLASRLQAPSGIPLLTCARVLDAPIGRQNGLDGQELGCLYGDAAAGNARAMALATRSIPSRDSGPLFFRSLSERTGVEDPDRPDDATSSRGLLRSANGRSLRMPAWIRRAARFQDLTLDLDAVRATYEEASATTTPARSIAPQRVPFTSQTTLGRGLSHDKRAFQAVRTASPSPAKRSDRLGPACRQPAV